MILRIKLKDAGTVSRRRITIKVPMGSIKRRSMPLRWVLFEQNRNSIRSKRNKVRSELIVPDLFDADIWKRFLIVTNSLDITNIPLPREVGPSILALNDDGTIKFGRTGKLILTLNYFKSNKYWEYAIQLAKKNLSKLDTNPELKQKILQELTQFIISIKIRENQKISKSDINPKIMCYIRFLMCGGNESLLTSGKYELPSYKWFTKACFGWIWPASC